MPMTATNLGRIGDVMNFTHNNHMQLQILSYSNTQLVSLIIPLMTKQLSSKSFKSLQMFGALIALRSIPADCRQ